jgi:predicted MFS family arabinose efflux permease
MIVSAHRKQPTVKTIRPPTSADRTPLGLIAAGTAVSVSAVYLSQPILNVLAASFHASVRAMGAVVTVTQIGFGCGIIFLVPLGDVMAKKRLILGKLAALVAALTATGLVSTAAQMAACSLALGLFATAAQDFVPLAAELSPPERRGRAVGTVMGGLLLGILGSRFFSGAVAQAMGWRWSFFACAFLTLGILGLVWRRVPSVKQGHRASYPALLWSTVSLVGTQPLLVLSTFAQGWIGFTFSAFWTVLSFHLGGAPFRLSPAQIGAFALAGLAGAAMAPVAGRLADRHGPILNIRVALGLVAVAFVALLLAPGSLAVLVAATVVFDLGVQLSMVSHQTIIYALDPGARSRINAVYVGGLFGFFALGSFAATWAFTANGWTGVCLLCLASCGFSALLHAALSARWRRRPEMDSKAPAGDQPAPRMAKMAGSPFAAAREESGGRGSPS